MIYQPIPTLDQFLETSRKALAYLSDFGFEEVSPPSHRSRDPFQLWFRAGDRIVIVQGEGYGDMASIILEHTDGLELPEIYLAPTEGRPKPRRNRKKENTQLQQIRDAAQRLRLHGEDFLQGDLNRFMARARPLPPYKRATEDS